MRFLRKVLIAAVLVVVSGCKSESIVNVKIDGFGSGGTGTQPTGNVICDFKSSVGQQADGTIILAPKQIATVSGDCKDEKGISFTPYWYSGDVSVAGVTGDKVVLIKGVSFIAGSTVTVTAYGNGTTTVTMQAAIADRTVVFKRTIKVQ